MRLAPLQPVVRLQGRRRPVAVAGRNVSSGCTPKRPAPEESRGRHRAVSRGAEKLRRQWQRHAGFNVTAVAIKQRYTFFAEASSSG